MAQNTVYEPAGSLEVIAGETYNATNIPAVTTVVQLNMGERLLGKNGGKTPLRGVFVTIINNLTQPTNPKPNIPFLWLEGTIIAFDADYSYKFHNNGRVGYGRPVAI